MKENKFCYLGILFGLVMLVISFVLRENKPLQTVLIMCFSSITSISIANLYHNKLLKTDKFYKINMEDERNVRIKEKVGNEVLKIYMYLLGIITVIFIAYDYYIPAIFTGGLLVFAPIFLIIASNYFEKRL